MTQTTPKLHAGTLFPALSALRTDGSSRDLSKPDKDGCDWMMVVVYRGRHCPMCTRYLKALSPLVDKLGEIGVDVVAVSADSPQQLEQHKEALGELEVELLHSLSLDQMKALGLYISPPRSPKETDHDFAEPGLFVINHEGALQVVDISNNPFVRPELETLVRGLAWIRKPENDYPIRGTLE